MSDAKIAIVYHSGYGHTASQARAVARGAAIPGVETVLVPVEGADAPWEALAECDALIFGCPTYMGGQSAQFKAFQDATSSTVFAAGSLWRDKIAAGFTNSASRSGDKLATLQQLAIFAAQHGMHWVGLGLPPGNNSSSGSEEDLNRLGFFLGAAAQSNADEPADTAPPAADLRTAEHLGRRVAEVTLQFVRGREPAFA
ncbi:flavodoxin family protein [Sphingosinithalassobacter portus]|uniref:flavodoxin family protein n=1 Tax=Stakelama portus TaxID=2676234 RepID=UPI000D6DF0D5|nr:flavodoxin family protein [Sphingosinithalassobacter portus]